MRRGIFKLIVVIVIGIALLIYFKIDLRGWWENADWFRGFWDNLLEGPLVSIWEWIKEKATYLTDKV